MTAAISKAVQLSIKLRKEYPYLHCDITTDSVPSVVKVEDGTT